MDDTIISEFLRTVDYLALEILCPICGIELKYQQDLSRSALKKHVTRHLVGHGKQVIKRVSCPGCHWGSSYPSRPHYLRHTNHCRVIKEKFPSVEFNKQVVRCPICLVRFSSVPQCATHCAEHHINSTNHSEKIYICEGCSAWYNSEMALHEHQSECFLYPRALSAAGIGVACGVCSIRFAKREKCEAHISQFHKISSNSFICVFCNMVLETLDGLIEHVNTICPLAQSISRTGHEDMRIDKKLNKAKVAMQKQVDAKSNYIDDENTNKARTNQKSKLKPLRRGWVQCKICFAKSKASDSEQHALIHSQKELRPYRCKVCDGGFNTTGNLHNHQFYCQRRKSIVEDLPDLPASPDVVSVSPSQSLNSIVDASQCNNELTLPRHEEYSSFASPTMLCDAEAISSPVHTQSPIDVPANLEIGVVQGESSFILTCDFCKKTFDTTELMAEHLVNFHGTAGLVCSICLKSFTFEETLTEHLLHCNDDSSGGVVNTCKEANTTENQGQGNDEVEEWKCLSCCIKFTKETNFLLHIASHEVTNVGKCSLCAASFKSAADICMHMVKYHRNFLMNGTKEGGSQDDSDKVMKNAVTNDKRSAPSKQNEYARATVADFKYHCLVGTKCLVCNRNFASKAILKRHYGIHDGYYNAVCPICGIGFCKRTMLRKHKVRVHRTAKATDSTCSRCGGAFEQEFRLKKHMEVCICPKNDSVVQCLQCVRTFDTWHQLKGHLWTHINKCTYCDEKISVQSKRVDHMLSCVKNPLITGECLPTSVKTVVSPPQKPLQSKAAPKSTKKIPEKNFKCKECCSEYTTMKALKKHEVVHEQAEYRCRVCGGKFSSLLAKNRHILREHESKTRIIKAAPKEEPKVEPTETVAEEPRQETFYMCTLCNRVFKDTETKLQHMRDAHGMDAPNNRKLIDCRHCGKRFPTKFARRRHLQTAHSGSNSQPQSLVCHLCTKRFPSNFAKLQHMKKIHKLTESELAPRKQKVCKVCGETFEGKSELKAHKRSVHSQLIMNNSIDLAPDMLLLGDASSSDLVFSPPKVRVCRHCDMTFVHKSELKAHCKAEHAHISHSSVPETRLLKMNGTAPTSSEYTSLTLNSAASNILVNNDIMKVKQRICKECGETFVSKTELKAHRKAEHKEKKTESISVDGEVLRLLQAGDAKQNNVKESTAFASTLTVPSDAEDDEPNRKRLRLDQVTVHTNEAIGSAPTSGSLPFRCEHCSKYFKLRILLNKHLTRAHPWMP
ncbi:zinc finger protein 845-like isoform X2 [Watersipora subatra]|uniref:zinc finger protein 845-like isoform X2 n=1 Tax=Watersipora subatra TaxID=2589382 RepID=UPI00355BD9B7